MVQGKWFEPGQPLEDAVLPVRRSVFGRGRDSLDDESWNACVYLDGRPVAAGRIWWKEDAFWLGDIGVLEECRNQCLGDLVLRLLLFKAQSHAAREVRLFSPPDTVGFFSRLGLEAVSPAGTDPIEMAVAGSAIDLDTCKSCRKTNCPNRR